MYTLINIQEQFHKKCSSIHSLQNELKKSNIKIKSHDAT